MNCVNVYKYSSVDDQPVFEQIQQISTLGKSYNDKSAAAALRFSSDSTKLFVSNAGDNSVAFFERDVETGLLTKRSVLPVSGDYPKQICVFPDDKHIASMNHESGTITFFKIDYEKGLLIMNGAPIKVETPNVAVIAKLED
jgi:6-phosphogluconolactonase